MSMNPLVKKNQGSQQEPQQNPREAVMDRMRQMGIDVPQGMENDPNALLQHVMQCGKVPQAQNRLNMAQQMIQRAFGGRR